jgi:hypothetical protein
MEDEITPQTMAPLLDHAMEFGINPETLARVLDAMFIVKVINRVCRLIKTNRSYRITSKIDQIMSTISLLCYAQLKVWIS